MIDQLTDTDAVDWSLWPIGKHQHHIGYKTLELPHQLDSTHDSWLISDCLY